jgi:Flp pilus assembly protein TadG
MNTGKPSWGSAEAGTTTVEAGVTISFLLLLILGTVEFGQTFCTYNTMLLSVEQAGRYAMVNNQGTPDTCGAQSQAPGCPTVTNTPLANCSAARAQQVLSAYQGPNVGVSVAEDMTTSPATITICASYSVDFIPPQLLPYGPINLTRQVTVPLI